LGAGRFELGATVKLGGSPLGELRPALALRDDVRENGGALDVVRALPTKRRTLVPRPHPYADRTSSWANDVYRRTRRCVTGVLLRTVRGRLARLRRPH
jgi:hypothetical protein